MAESIRDEIAEALDWGFCPNCGNTLKGWERGYCQACLHNAFERIETALVATINYYRICGATQEEIQRWGDAAIRAGLAALQKGGSDE